MISDFESKLLYDQSSLTEEGVSILSSMYTVSYTYPGANMKTIARFRLTCIYSLSGGIMTTHGGTIEKWRNEGWTLVDEFHDDSLDMITPNEFRKHLLDQVQSFITGIPLSMINNQYALKNNNELINKNENKDIEKPKLHVIEFEKKKETNKKETNKKETNKKDKDDDFDLI